MFNEFGITLAVAVVISSWVALTLSPMLCAKVLKVPKTHGRIFQAFEHTFLAVADRYQRALTWAMRHRWLVIGGAAASVVVAFGVFRALKREFVPPEDRGFFVTITVAPEGASLGYTDSYQRRIEEILGRTEGIDAYFSVVGWGGRVNSGIGFVRLAEWEERDRSVQEVIGEVQPQLFGLPGVFAFANQPPAFGFGSPVQFVVRHPDFDSLAVGMARFVPRARQITGLINVDTDLRVNKPELVVCKPCWAGSVSARSRGPTSCTT